MKPINAIDEMDKWKIPRPIIPPVNASGTVNITINGDRRLWNCATMIR